MEKRYTWIVRFDVVPEWVADGFVIDDARANDMLATALPMAAEQHEIRAAVIAAPYARDIAGEQGYKLDTIRARSLCDDIRSAAPLAYRSALDRVLWCAIGYISTAGMPSDARKEVLAELNAALSLIRGDGDLPAQEPHGNAPGND